MRALLKRSIEWTLASRPVTAITQRKLRGQTLILAYHGVAPHAARGTAAGERTLFVTQATFASQLDVLAQVADVVALRDIDAPSTSDRVRVAITFDDAYQGAVTCAIDELEARNMPATIFVAPGYLGGKIFWWDALAHANGEMPAIARTHALDVLHGMDDAVRAWAQSVNLPVATDLPGWARSATIAELRHAVTRRGITLGSHTWSHANVSRLVESELRRELEDSRAWLTAEAKDRYVPWLAYPYGLDSVNAQRVARECGYEFAALVAGGWHNATDVSPFARPRMNVGAGLSLDGFRARLLGSRRA